MFARWKARVGLLKREIAAVAIAARDPRTPRTARLLIAAIVAYAVSPIDLIPDFIPIIGWLDELILLPIALSLAMHLIPTDVLADARAAASDARVAPSWTAAAVIIGLWAAMLGLLALAAWRWLS